RLLRRGEFNLHSPVTALVRLVAAAGAAAGAGASSGAAAGASSGAAAGASSGAAAGASSGAAAGASSGAAAVAAEPQQVCLAATAAGAVHAVAMVPEKSFKRLRRVAARLSHAAPPLAGLNPREFRAVPLHRRQYAPPRPATVLDGDLLAPLYAHAPLSRQHDAAQRDGTSADRVLRDIVAIERAFNYF
ncbi:mRNA cleavage and polyadenylation factor subunit, partial [Coemansia erecta]